MGREKSTRRRQRNSVKRGRGNPADAAMAFTDDQRERTDQPTKALRQAEQIWLGASLIASHRVPFRQSNAVMAREAQDSLNHLASSSFGKSAQVFVEPPERGTKTWFLEIIGEHQGLPIEFEMEAASVDEIVGSALVWINYKVSQA